MANNSGSDDNVSMTNVNVPEAGIYLDRPSFGKDRLLVYPQDPAAV